MQPFLAKEGLTANRFSLLLIVTTPNKRGEDALSVVNPGRENDDILKEYDGLPEEDIQTCLLYAFA